MSYVAFFIETSVIINMCMESRTVVMNVISWSRFVQHTHDNILTKWGAIEHLHQSCSVRFNYFPSAPVIIHT